VWFEQQVVRPRGRRRAAGINAIGQGQARDIQIGSDPDRVAPGAVETGNRLVGVVQHLTAGFTDFQPAEGDDGAGEEAAGKGQVEGVPRALVHVGEHRLRFAERIDDVPACGAAVGVYGALQVFGR